MTAWSAGLGLPGWRWRAMRQSLRDTASY
jgi:hypothetical protein